MKKFHPSKLEPKTDKCIFIGHPKQLGIPPISDLEAKVIASRNESFLEEKFLLKEVSGRKVELDEVTMIMELQTKLLLILVDQPE